jgi:predicted transcriptional regulator of viral defense system
MERSGEKRRSGRRYSPQGALEWLISELAFAQHGVLALAQLVEFGLSARAVRDRVAAGRLHRVHAGVFAVGHAPLTRQGHYMAAVLACGEDAGLACREAAALRHLRAGNRATVDVISPRRAGRGLRGIDAHTSSTLLPRDIEKVDGIPCTSVARTLLDLAAVLPRRAVERAFDQAEVLRVLDARAIEDVLRRTHGHRGNATLRSILRDHAPASTLTRNELEEAFLAICDAAGLPRPAVNARIALEPGGYEADFLWRAEGLIAEADGRAAHATGRSFEHDRRRDQRLMLAGYRVVRFARSQIVEDPGSVRDTLQGLLRRAA